MRLSVQGLLLFLFIPLVLVLLLRQPIGPAPSLALGLLVMFTHRFIAAPWAGRHAAARCAWCAATVSDGVQFDVQSGGRAWKLAACSERHANRAARFLTLTWRWRAPIAAGIFLPLLLLVAGTVAIAAGRPFFAHDTNALQFRVVVAVTVLTASLAYTAIGRPDARLRCPFPLHNVLLLGIRQTLWIFRIVGTWWIADAVKQMVD